MLDSFDFKEPSCALCGGKEFYNPKKDDPDGRIPVGRVIEKADGLLAKNDLSGAQSLYEYWQNEARVLKDKQGELSMVNELLGCYRKSGEKKKGLDSCERAERLVDSLGLQTTLSGATVLLNAATTMKAFGKAESALQIYQKVYEVYSVQLDENDVKMAGLYNNRALAFQDTGNLSAAQDDFFKALKIMERAENGQADLAVTYVNLAHLYEQAGKDKKEITDCLFSAYGLLTGEQIKKDSYYAFVLSKCAPSYRYFGYEVIAREFEKNSNEIYART